MKFLLVLLSLSSGFQHSKLKPTDLDLLEGKHWKGALTYLDYSSHKKVSIPTELIVIGKGGGVYVNKFIRKKEVLYAVTTHWFIRNILELTAD